MGSIPGPDLLLEKARARAAVIGKYLGRRSFGENWDDAD